MYIIKNALRCIGRAKGRNVLIGIAKTIVNTHKGKIKVLCYDGLVEFRVELPAV